MSPEALSSKASAVSEGLIGSPHPLFDINWYKSTNADLPEQVATFGHYLSHGWRQHKSPHPLFHVDYYLRN